jgi:hypothetical protein
MRFEHAARKLHFGGSATVNDYIIEGNLGNATNNSGGILTVKGADAWAAVGNGNGGNLVLQSGNKRAAGSGTDGDVIINAFTAQIEMDAAFINAVATSNAYFYGAAVTEIGAGGSATTINGTTTTIVCVSGGNVVIGNVGIGSDVNIVTSEANTNYLKITGLKTSSAGLPANTVWNDGGHLAIT